MKNLVKKISSPNLIAFIVLLISVAIIMIATKTLYDRTVTLLTENLRERISTISITAAASIKAEDIQALNSEEDWLKPEWANVVNNLHKAKYNNKDVVYMYIFRKNAGDPTQMEFVADADSINPYANIENAPDNGLISSSSCTLCIDVNRDGIIESDGPDKLQFPGQDYPEAVDIPETFEAYNGPITSSELYTDAYGTVLTGYAPITDDAGNVVAILATDIKANDFFTITKQTLQPFLVFILFLIGIISLLTVSIIYTWGKYSKSLELLNKQILSTNEKLKVLDRQKSEFVSLASHQLRGPLTAIKGYTSLIIEGDMGPVSDQVRGAADRIFKSAQSLVIIVGDFLDVSRIEQGRMKYDITDFDMKVLIKSVIEDFRPIVDQKGLKLESEIEDGETYLISADMNKLKQVLNNLIDNSIKYTPSGWIKVSLSKNEDNQIKVMIQDSGVGMTKQITEHLFKKFSRAENASKTNVMGTGLGLFVAKEMVKAHRGNIWAESDGEGKGSTFIVELQGK